ncbi:MAG: lipoprotein [Chitinophagaceae bacterium]
MRQLYIRRYLFALSLLLLLAACSNSSKKNKEQKSRNPPPGVTDTVPLPPVKNPDNKD